MKPFHLGVLVPIWRRAALTRVVLGHWRRLAVELAPSRIRLTVAVAGSPEDDDAHRLHAYFRTSKMLRGADPLVWTWHSNFPVSNKWNAALRRFEHTDVDAVMIAGSDDLISLDYIIETVRLLNSGSQFVGADGLYFYDRHSDSSFFTNVSRMGAGMTFTTHALKASRYALWPPDRNEGVDSNMPERMRNYRVTEYGVIHVELLGDYCLLDVKTRENVGGVLENSNINSYSRARAAFGERGVTVEPGALFRRYFPELEEIIRNLPM